LAAAVKVGVGGHDIDGCDLVAETADEPTKGCGPASTAKAGFVLAKSGAARVSVFGSHGVALARATASSNRFASFAAARGAAGWA